jgi:hypothetical protein
MNRAELVSVVKSILHRSDLDSQMQAFIDTTTARINLRLGLSLVSPVADSDTNEILTDWHPIYTYGVLETAYEFTNDGDNATYYGSGFLSEMDRYNITRDGTEPLYMAGA